MAEVNPGNCKRNNNVIDLSCVCSADRWNFIYWLGRIHSQNVQCQKKSQIIDAELDKRDMAHHTRKRDVFFLWQQQGLLGCWV